MAGIQSISIATQALMSAQDRISNAASKVSAGIAQGGDGMAVAAFVTLSSQTHAVRANIQVLETTNTLNREIVDIIA